MPYWFKKQLRNAYFNKDRYQIKLLNQCWFFYRKKHCS
ncbi:MULTISPECIES: cortex morphogenetic protein CmpA [Bacillales]|uniref:Cortex morphogenetic protein CmpA n=1 Tax=Pseudalkalibacillus berkeleyi TaxID=1069813 RepID=A0ABS9H651_9BACL|nr:MULTISPECIES: cortex morphogenetic protein CmpA [Bacillaceae]MCF6139342.1 cortex morphogenetic protein CmpA [Pseudalkalibacillus berkeleyi]MCF6411811.1 cortex morphogenetic protein CmpA [Pseudalkalibacillus salsuginis]